MRDSILAVIMNRLTPIAPYRNPSKSSECSECSTNTDTADTTSDTHTIITNFFDGTNHVMVGVRTLDNGNYYNYRFGSTWYVSSVERTEGWHLFKIVWDGSVYKIYIDDNYVDTSPTGYGSPTTIVLGGYWDEDITGYYDTVRVRKYVETYIDREQMFNLYPHTEFRDVFTMFLIGAAGDLQPSLAIYRYKDKIVDRKRAFVEILGDYIISLASKIKTSAKVDLKYKWTNIKIPIRPEFIDRIRSRT